MELFQLHAQQRLTTFNFYLVIASVLTTALIASFQQDKSRTLISAGIGLLLALFSYVFAKLDVRNKQLIQNAEESLEAFETEWAAAWAKDVTALASAVFTRDSKNVAAIRKASKFWALTQRHWSYSDCFRMAFVAFGSLGFGSVVISLALYLFH